MTLDEYIIANAGHGADESFARAFSAAEVFFAIDPAVVGALEGSISIPAGMALGLQVVRLEFGRMALFYASRDDARLGAKFAGMPLIRGAQLVCELPDVDGMLLQSSGNAWFVARKRLLREVIGQVRDDTFYLDFSDPSANS